MKVALICFSLTGQQTGERLCRGLEAAGMTAELDKKSKYLPDSIQISTSAWAGEKFPDSDALIFIGATGIAVRSIAPYVASKKSDPAVLVVDECGKFVISLLSGHLGGANELALKTAEILEAIPVVTTATDLHHRFAVDVFAKKNNCNIFNMKAAKEVSAALLAGKKVGFYSEFPTDGELPELFTQNNARQLIHITYGPILTAKNADGSTRFRERLYTLWRKEREFYTVDIEKHVGRHLELLYGGRDGWPE